MVLPQATMTEFIVSGSTHGLGSTIYALMTTHSMRFAGVLNRSVKKRQNVSPIVGLLFVITVRNGTLAKKSIRFKEFRGRTAGKPRRSKKNKYGLRKRGRKN